MPAVKPLPLPATPAEVLNAQGEAGWYWNALYVPVPTGGASKLESWGWLDGVALTATEALPSEEQELQALPDDRILELAGLGLRIEGHYGREQDIEWCLAEGKFFIVQARPITSLYPAPRAADGRLHLYASFGHVQMMTEAMKPLGISALRTFAPVGDRSASGETELLQEAGSRLFLDLNAALRYRRLRRLLPRVLPLADERIARVVAEFLER